MIVRGRFLDLSGLNDGAPLTQRQRLLMLAKVMEVYELCEAPENMAFYVHGQGHAIEHDSRQLIVSSRLSAVTFLAAVFPARKGS